MNDLIRAKNIFTTNNYSLVLCHGDAIYVSSKNGIAPLLEYTTTNLSEFSIADKIIGKAAAMLLIESKIKAIYTPIMSQNAASILGEYQIKYIADNIVETILDHTGTNSCPMELAVKEIQDPKLARTAIMAKIQELKNSFQIQKETRIDNEFDRI